MSRAAAVIAVVLLIYFLRVSRPVLLPLVAALFVIMLAWPAQRWLARRTPWAIAVALTFLATLVAVAGVLWMLAWCAELVIEHARQNPDAIERARSLLARATARVGIDLPAIGQGGGGGGGGNPSGNTVASAARMVESAFGLLFLALAFVALGMAEIRAAERRVRRQLGDQADRIFELTEEISVAFRRFVAAKSLASLLTGIASFALAAALGLDLAVVWGFLAFLLEYVPTIGSMLAVVPPTLFAFIESEDVRRPLIVLASFSVLQVVMGNFVDPRIEGRILAISPFAVLLAIVFWGWVWGVPGAVLGVPLTVAVLIACRHFERARWVADLLEDRRE